MEDKDDRKAVVGRILSSFDRIAQAVIANRSITEGAKRPLVEIFDLGRPLFQKGMDSAEDEAAASIISVLDRLTGDAEQTVLEADEAEVISQVAVIAELILQAGRCAIVDEKNDEEHRKNLALEHRRIQADARYVVGLQQTARLRQAADRADEVVSHIEHAAGGAASVKLADYYSEHAKRERIRYFFWTALLLVIVGVAITIAWITLGKTPDKAVFGPEIGKLALLLPLLALGAYAGRQASYHRNSEATASWIEVQLRTVHAFIDSLNVDSRQEIMKQLGLKLFTGGKEGSDGHIDQFGFSTELLKLLGDKSPDRK